MIKLYWMQAGIIQTPRNRGTSHARLMGAARHRQRTSRAAARRCLTGPGRGHEQRRRGPLASPDGCIAQAGSHSYNLDSYCNST